MNNDNNWSADGLIIMSEFTGASRVLSGSLAINPWNTTGILSCCERALKMTQAEKERRFLMNYYYLQKSSMVKW